MQKNLTLLDGAVGTSLWEKAEDKAPVWRYNLENPTIVSELHREYIDAGAEIILAKMPERSPLRPIPFAR